MSVSVIEDYQEFIDYLNTNRLAHCARMIQNGGCKIIVAINREISSEHDVIYGNWCNENCSGKYFVYNENYVFFDIDEDAVAFKLRWI